MTAEESFPGAANQQLPDISRVSKREPSEKPEPTTWFSETGPKQRVETHVRDETKIPRATRGNETKATACLSQQKASNKLKFYPD